MDKRPKISLVKNQTAVCVIEDYTQEGFGVARVDGCVVFVRNAVREERCVIKIVKVKSNLCYAIVQEVLQKSPHRTENDCSAFPVCGGCVFRHIDYAEEIAFKARHAQQLLEKIGGVKLPPEQTIAADDISGYRNKASFPIGWDGDTPIIGFYRPRTHEIAPVTACLLQKSEINICTGVLRDWLTQTRFKELRHMVARVGDGGVLVCLTSTQKPPHSISCFIDKLRTRLPCLSGVVWDRHSGQGNVILSGNITKLWGKDTVSDCLYGIKNELSIMSFYQVNKKQAEKLYAKAVEYAGEFDTAIDLYCGAGSLTLMLGKTGKSVVGVDIEPQAIANAKASAKANDISNVRYICGDVGKLSQKLSADVVIIDPPRKGLSPEAIEAVCAVGSGRLIYISCDPATLARDIKLLTVRGYFVRKHSIVDMFPRTGHVECVVLMSRVEKQQQNKLTQKS